MSTITLPPLRDELALYTGAPAKDGSPTWIIHDPARNQFFHIGWGAFEIISRWTLRHPDTIIERVQEETTLSISNQDVVGIAQFLAANHLIKFQGAEGTARFLKTVARMKRSWISRLLHNYLFFRVPLIHPDRFLSATVNSLSWVWSRSFVIVTGLVLLLGLGLVTRQWDVFTTTLIETLTWEGLLHYVTALVIAKLTHEFAHAYTAKRFGCHIPTMGIAFLVLWPIPYTDTTETWKLREKHQRMAVGAAGMMAEISLAAYATLAWSFLPQGEMREAAFILATVAWISSFTTNLLPFLRFDGYYLLSDWLETPNLHQRSFAMGKWWLRETLFKLGETPPERLSSKRTRLLVAFAFVVWIYRLFLFLGIAVLVYHFFIKLVGIVLFVVEISWFILRPIVQEIKTWSTYRRTILRSRRTLVSASILGVLIALGSIPWYGRIMAPALLQTREQVVLYTTSPALITDIAVSENQLVTSDDILFFLANPDLERKLEQTENRIKMLDYELKSANFEESFRKRNQTILAVLEKAEAERAGLNKESSRLTISSPFPVGRVVDLDPHLTPGQWIGTSHRLATILRTNIEGRHGVGIIAYVNENAVHRIAPGANCRFYAKALQQGGIECTVSLVEKTAPRFLAEPAFASVFGGEIGVRIIKGGNMAPERAYYRVRIIVEEMEWLPNMQVRGKVSIRANQESFFAKFWRFAIGVLIRESGM
uniref:Putative peptide zinc metalloprotease protein n=1 Tax=Candidatus Kentrum sp. TUN TaxID=2126343 RepID=A0A450ZBY7_9GAMM|nr:MAG: putative peptide zinc metalloprotease protein [Candidatus Kentron sp. TUN]VFK51314.1 MAG: putative peptide zinc metalloprotease protein [Candidatus Kentron sp. TUN]VFK55828.1 MAG: putative peptide zinc metalloprotease protein [Candidatus Kentron sp. TUN]